MVVETVLEHWISIESQDEVVFLCGINLGSLEFFP